MLDMTKKNLAAGITRVKWIAEFLAERTKAETVIAKLSYERIKLEKKVDDLYREIGKRVQALSDLGDREVLDDHTVQRSLSEIKAVNETIARNRKQSESMNKDRQ